jgi:hypothetical protein
MQVDAIQQIPGEGQADGTLSAKSWLSLVNIIFMASRYDRLLCPVAMAATGFGLLAGAPSCTLSVGEYRRTARR